MNLKETLVWVSAATGIIAAFFWYKSTVAKSAPTPEKEGADHYDAGIIITDDENPEKKPYELFATLELQSFWSKWAAIFASLSAVLQAISLIAQ